MIGYRLFIEIEVCGNGIYESAFNPYFAKLIIGKTEFAGT
jgi:hypothetical protein